MARPNRVFYISNELNFFNKTAKNIDEVKDIFIGCLVTGFGPFPVVSVTVLDGVATVDIGEPCKIYPGVKISLNGTGNADLDTWHECQSLEGNTFSFNVETSNGTYSNGITLSYPSLGWQLLDRDANNFLLQSGNSGSSKHKIHVEVKRSTSDAYSWFFVFKRILDDAILIKDIKNISPLNRDITLYVYYQDIASIKNYFHCYGDDCFALFGIKNFYNYVDVGDNYGSDLINITFGEIKKTKFNVGSFILDGTALEAGSKNYGYAVYDNSYSGIYYGPAIRSNNKSLSTLLNEKGSYETSFINDCFLNFSNISTKASGLTTTQELSNSRFTPSNNYSTINILTLDFDLVGTIPGIYYTLRRPLGSFLFQKAHLLKVKPEGDLKNRHVYNKIFGYIDYFTGAQPITSAKSSVLLDLTGPIR